MAVTVNIYVAGKCMRLGRNAENQGIQGRSDNTVRHVDVIFATLLSSFFYVVLNMSIAFSALGSVFSCDLIET